MCQYSYGASSEGLRFELSMPKRDGLRAAMAIAIDEELDGEKTNGSPEGYIDTNTRFWIYLSVSVI